MSERTAIAWCDSTFNPWIGCTEVSPGCDNCYAREQDARKRWDDGKTHWGPGVPRYRTSEANWKQPLAWNRKATKDGKPHRVFCASLADVLDNEVPYEWRNDLWTLVEATPHLSWLLVTKRIGNVQKFAPKSWLSLGFPDHVRLLITVCNQEEADRDIPKLLALPCKNGISYEPALGAIDFFCNGRIDGGAKWNVLTSNPGIQWVIVGGESGSKARPFVLGWGKDTIRQCQAAGVPVFFKQAGSRAVNREGMSHPFLDRAGADLSEWPEDLKVREFP